MISMGSFWDVFHSFFCRIRRYVCQIGYSLSGFLVTIVVLVIKCGMNVAIATDSNTNMDMSLTMRQNSKTGT